MSGTGVEKWASIPRVESLLDEKTIEQPASTDYRAFGIAGDEFMRHVAMLELRLRTGNGHLFAYHLLGRVDRNLSHGIELIFGDAVVTLTGRNLSTLYIALRDQKVSWVQEADERIARLVPSGAPLVESVVVELNVRGR